uniref:Sugar transporter SWEET1 n=1 Tax=Oryctolagus cuniculus TaxID=9986 RepID=A0A5F9CIT1_RABIT
MKVGGVVDWLLSGACVLFTIGMFSTGLSDLRHMQMTRRVDSVQFLPSLTTDINNLGWLSYGTLKGDGTLMLVNAMGAVLQTLDILVYLHYCPQKVVQTKSTKRLFFSLTIVTLFTSASWSLNGFQLQDPYIIVPNLPEILTSFWLFWKYPQEQDRNYQLLQT